MTKLPKKSRPKRHVNITAALALLKVNASVQVVEIVETAISEIERLQRIEMAALAIVTAKTDGVELDASHEAWQTILELAQ